MTLPEFCYVVFNTGIVDHFASETKSIECVTVTVVCSFSLLREDTGESLVID